MLNKKLISLFISVILLVSFLGTNLATAYAQSLVPSWIKDNAGWWADGSITDQDFVSGIQYLIEIGVIIIPPTQATGAETQIPSWIKDNAMWWSQDLITENDFILGIQYMIEVGIITIQTDDEKIEPLKIITNHISKGVLNQDYSQSLRSVGGVEPHEWQIVSGNLPAGVTLVKDGTFEGKPLELGEFPLRVQVQDFSGKTQSLDFSIKVVNFGLGFGEPRVTTTENLIHSFIAAPGEEVIVPLSLYLNHDVSLKEFQIDIAFDQLMLDFVSAEKWRRFTRL